MSKTVTEPFDGNVKPVHVGYYERQYGSVFLPTCDYWDGNYWFYFKSTHPDDRCHLQNLPWRGLAEKPE